MESSVAKTNTVTFYHVNYTNPTVPGDHWIGFDNIKHHRIMTALDTERCRAAFIKEDTFDRQKAEHFVEVAHTLCLSDMSGVGVYLPDAYDEETEKILIDALAQKKWHLFLEKLVIETKRYWTD